MDDKASANELIITIYVPQWIWPLTLYPWSRILRVLGKDRLTEPTRRKDALRVYNTVLLNMKTMSNYCSPDISIKSCLQTVVNNRV
jgi:hypothetical protein